MRVNVIIIPKNVVTNLPLYLLRSCKSQKQESIFREVGALVAPW